MKNINILNINIFYINVLNKYKKRLVGQQSNNKGTNLKYKICILYNKTECIILL